MPMLLTDAARYEGLPYVVETTERQGPTRWEAMAAFNVGRVATRYADDCRKANPGQLYRVMSREDGQRDTGWRVYQATS
jgi:hypothetical protein